MNPILTQADAIFFDLDGTLVDSVPDLARAVDQMLTELGYDAAGEDKVRHWVGNGAPALVKRALADDAHGDEGDRVADADYQAAYPLFAKYYEQSVVHATGLYDGVREFLLAAHAKPTALITNKPRKFTLMILEALELLPFFDVVVCGDDYDHKKPHPEPLIQALASLNQKNSNQQNSGLVMANTVMIGDSVSDIKAAQAAGCQSIAVTYGYNHGQCASTLDSDYTVDSLLELLS